MKKTSLLFLFNCLIISSCFAQQESINSQIVNKEGIGLPYVSIGILQTNVGTVSFEDGTFQLPIKSVYLDDTVIIAALGYQRKYIPYQQLVTEKPKTIMLEEQAMALNEVTIEAAELAFSTIGIQKNSSRDNFGISAPLKGITIAMLFDEVESPLFIQEISVVIGKANMDSVQLRCRIFEVDTVTGLPGNDLLQEEIILTGLKKREKLTVILEDGFWVSKPFYIGFEWVASKEQMTQLTQVHERYPTPFISEIAAKYPDLNMTINEQKRAHFRDSTNTVVQEVPLTRDQIKQLKEKDAAGPKLLFKVLSKGTKTYYGLPLRNAWSRIPHEALISVKVGKEVMK